MFFRGIINLGKTTFEKHPPEEFDVSCSDVLFKRDTLDLFQEDNLILNSIELFISIEGYILNDKHLFHKYNCTNLEELFKLLWNQKGDLWINEIDGEISAIIFDKRDKKLFLYTNIISSKPIFYYCINNSVIIGRTPFDVLHLLKEKSLILDEESCRFFLQYSVYPEDRTMFKGLSRLQAGTYVVINQENIQKKTFFKLTAKPNNNKNYDKLLEDLNTKFDEAVRNCIEKNIRANKRTLITLSGGLDSRMIVLSAHKQGYDFDTLCFAQKGSWDHLIATQLSKKLKKKNIFIDLTGGDYLFDYEKLISINGGYSSFKGASQSYYSFKKIEQDLGQYGLVLTGQMGDVFVGCTYNKKGVLRPPPSR